MEAQKMDNNNNIRADESTLRYDPQQTKANGAEDILSGRKLRSYPGFRQSPIDIDCVLAESNNSFKDLTYSFCLDEKARLVNDGKTPACYFTPGMHFLTGGPLDQTYELVQYHIHFSGYDDHGSEHTVGGRGFPAEIHFVHYKVEYGNFDSAVKHHDGLAVVGAFVEINDNNRRVSRHLNSDIMKMTNIEHAGATYATAVDLAEYDLQKRKHFYTYSGSLTSEPFQECVEWILLKDPIMITAEAFGVLKKLHSSKGDTMFNCGNSRCLQKRNGREIGCNFRLY